MANERAQSLAARKRGIVVKKYSEKKKQAVIALAIKLETIMDYKRYSSWYKLLRIGAYMLRFIHNIKCNKGERKIGTIITKESNESMLMIIKSVQSEEFIEEMKDLKRNGRVKRRSRLIALLPFLDEKGIMRIGGRLKNATIAEEMKQPIILPSRHHVTVDKTLPQKKMMHAGVQTTLNSIRESFWPILAKNGVKEMLRKCVKCRKASPRPSCQLMGQLPNVRVNSARPFLNSSVDYCGPFLVRDRIRRNSKQYKAYVAVFICMVVKAVHIELVEDLSTEFFIAALKRFMARRGKVKKYSNNGTNFVGADRTL